MFDLITGEAAHIPSRPAGPLLVSTLAHIAVATAVVLVSVALVTERLPDVPTMIAFVAEAPAPPSPPPPPPPPAAPAPAEQPRRAEPVRVPTPQPTPAPVTAPADILPEPPVEAVAAVADATEGGVPGGVPGGVAGGVIGGTVGGVPGGVIGGVVPLAAQVVPPPPPAPVMPVRVGGIVDVPTLLHRVEPEYPSAAVAANLHGVVIIEALVDETGCVTDAKVLRSAGSILDRSALAAVRQWRYTPLLHNGRYTPFVLTVTLSFTLQPARR